MSTASRSLAGDGGQGQPPPLQFSPFSTQISPSFWTALARIKIDRLQLSDDSLEDVHGRYTFGKSIVDRGSASSNVVHLPTSVAFDDDSLENTLRSPDYPSIAMRGSMKNFNTIEDFKKADKSAILQKEGTDLLHRIMHDDDPTPHLSRFLLFSFADLKKYKFVHWFAFPALVVQPTWKLVQDWQGADEAVGHERVQAVVRSIQQASASLNGFFLVDASTGQTGSVMEYDSFFVKNNVAEGDRIVGFVDPSSLPGTPGWPLRNLLTLLACRFNVRATRILCLREEGKSIVGTVSIDGTSASSDDAKPLYEHGGKRLPIASSAGGALTVVGWERNATGKLAPKMADLGPLMDPKRLADQAVDLNLKLMRWRILPEIDLDRISSTKCLLLGAGTLGCYVARTLMAWGVRQITFVDSSTVSFSNPVRQPLFTFDDCLEGGKPKAQCAADALRTIYPGVVATGLQLSIPMPGHPIPPANVEDVKRDVQRLETLFDEHDVVYLLMDSRESRWLPTVMGAAKGKVVMNTALGFDSFLAMRHGAGPSQHQHAKEANASSSDRLGCYFCNDIVAPSDSLTDRTLDQMCTVTRPGLAAIASACTVEMMVSLLQHPQGALAPAAVANSRTAEARADTEAQGSILGPLPHQIRGSLFTFQNLLINGPAYDKCTACSPTVLDAYVSHGFDVIQKACNEETYLRSLTGLDKLYDATDDIEVEWSEDDTNEDEGDGELL